MYALIGNINFSSKANDSRVDNPFAVKSAKVKYFLHYCLSNNLTPVFSGQFFDKNSSIKNLYEVFELLQKSQAKERIVFISEDYKVRMLSEMLRARTATPLEFNQEQSILHLSSSDEQFKEELHKFYVVIEKSAGNNISRITESTLKATLGGIYRESFEDSSIQTGFFDIRNTGINEVQFNLDNDAFLTKDIISKSPLGSADFAKKLKEFDDGFSDDCKIEGIVNKVLFDMHSDEFESETLKELLKQTYFDE
jgi:hypothetical protein